MKARWKIRKQRTRIDYDTTKLKKKTLLGMSESYVESNVTGKVMTEEDTRIRRRSFYKMC